MSTLAGSTVLVTGASGTVGSAVAARLATEGCRVRAPDRSAFSEESWGVDLAVHCAAARSDLDECRRVNVDGVQHLVDALVAGGCRLLVQVSTLSVYDDAAGPDFDEDSPQWQKPDNAYGFTKAESERIIRRAEPSGLASVILRPAMVLSMHPRSRWGPLALDRARATPDSILPFPEIPYVHVDDLVGAIVRAATTPAAYGRAYNVVDGVGDTRDYLSVVYGAIGRAPPAISEDAPRLRFAADRIRRELAWQPAPARWRRFLDELSLVPG